MRIYIEIIKNTIQANIAYRINVLLSIISKFLILLVQIYIWQALISGTDKIATGTQTINLRDMITYVIISAGLSIFMEQSVISKMDSKIKSGEIAMELIKPFSFKGYQFSEMFATSLYRTFIEFIPLLVVSMVIFGFYFPNVNYFLLFVIATGNGIVINFLIAYIFGLVGFWYISIGHLNSLLFTLIRLFSGAIVPLWFFPKSLYLISLVLPFKYMYFVPISVYLGKLSYSETISNILQQFLWIVFLLLIEKILWRKGIHKLVVHGG